MLKFQGVTQPLMTLDFIEKTLDIYVISKLIA